MASKILSGKLGLKSTGDLEKLKRETGALKKKALEDSAKPKDGARSRPPENHVHFAKPKGAASDPEVRNFSAEIRRRAPDPPQAPSKTVMQSPTQDPSKEDALNNVQILEARLKDALEKNQQWLVYDQQREVYVQGLMARIFDLERQAAGTKESSSDGKEEEKPSDGLLLAVKKDLEEERQGRARLECELSRLKIQLEEKSKEASELSGALKSRAEAEQQQRDDDRRRVREKMQKLKSELDVYREMYEDEKRKNSELSNQMEKMQSSLQRQQEDQQKVAALEQQIQRCTSDLENEKMDRRNVQHQLDKVLKELRKTREQITKLEPGKRDIYFVDTSGNFASEFDNKLTAREQHQSPKIRNPLDESFLECPRCRVVYPTSQHRELLAHLDFCTS
ncbi:centrosomal protein of 55 kDa [Gastrophryne carolinensis]